MNNRKQKQIFLDGEGNCWFHRNNHHSFLDFQPNEDRVLFSLNPLLGEFAVPGSRVLEIGCGRGDRLVWLEKNTPLECYGLDPSDKAVTLANEIGVKAAIGTADNLPFENSFFDIVIFGFCLYLCDVDDLPKISSEAFRVLKPNSYLVLHDFYSKSPRSVEYAHHKDVMTHKMDYRKLFDWHPHMTCFSHELRHHETQELTDDQSNWVSVSILKYKKKK